MSLRQAAQDVLELVQWIRDQLDVVRRGGDIGISHVLTDKLRAALDEPDPELQRERAVLDEALDALRQMVEGMEQASAGERIDFQGYAMGGRSVLEKIKGVE